jgi:hypothetical protein
MDFFCFESDFYIDKFIIAENRARVHFLNTKDWLVFWLFLGLPGLGSF